MNATEMKMKHHNGTATMEMGQGRHDDEARRWGKAISADVILPHNHTTTKPNQLPYFFFLLSGLEELQRGIGRDVLV